MQLSVFNSVCTLFYMFSRDNSVVHWLSNVRFYEVRFQNGLWNRILASMRWLLFWNLVMLLWFLVFIQKWAFLTTVSFFHVNLSWVCIHSVSSRIVYCSIFFLRSQFLSIFRRINSKWNQIHRFACHLLEISECSRFCFFFQIKKKKLNTPLRFRNWADFDRYEISCNHGSDAMVNEWFRL